MTFEYTEIYARFYSSRHRDSEALFEKIRTCLSSLGTVTAGAVSEYLSPISMEEKEHLTAQGYLLYNDGVGVFRIIKSRTFRLVSSESQLITKITELVGDNIVAVRNVREKSFEVEAR